MSASKSTLKDKAICDLVVSQYRSLEKNTTQISASVGLPVSTVYGILQQELPPEERKRLRGVYHSRAKMGASNPMFGTKKAAGRILRQGRAAVWNGEGYTFEHRLLVAQSLGLTELPAHWEVHHIDEDKSNNDLDNLAIVTKKGHRKLHRILLGKLYAWEKEMFGTSLLKEIEATLLKD